MPLATGTHALMAKTRFEVLLDDAMGQAITSLLKVEIGQADRVWYIRGVHAGLQQAKDAFRAAQKMPDEEDGL